MARRGTINAIMLAIAFVGVLVRFLGRLYLAATLQTRDDPGTVLIQMIVALALFAALFYANRRGFIMEAGLGFALVVLVGQFVVFDLTGSGMPGPAILLIPVLIAA